MPIKKHGGGGANVSGVTAAAGDVLDGKIIVSSAGAEVEGTMADNGTVSTDISSETTDDRWPRATGLE